MKWNLRWMIHVMLMSIFIVVLVPLQAETVHANGVSIEYDFRKIGLEYRGVKQPDDHLYHLRLIGDPGVVPSVYGTNFSSQIESRTPGLERSFSFDIPEAGLYSFELTGVLGSGGGYGDIYLQTDGPENEVLLFPRFDFFKHPSDASSYRTMTSPETIALSGGTYTLVFRAVGRSGSSTNFMYPNVLRLRSAEITPNPVVFVKEEPEDLTVTLPHGVYQVMEITNGSNVLIRGSDYVIEEESLTLKKDYLNTIDAGTIRLSIRLNVGIEIPLNVEIIEYRNETIELNFSQLSLTEVTDWYLTGLNPTDYPRVASSSLGGVHIALSYKVPKRSVSFKVETSGMYEIDFTGNLISNANSTAHTDIVLDTDPFENGGTKLFDQFYFVGQGRKTERGMMPVYLIKGMHKFTFVHTDPEFMVNNNIYPHSFTLTRLGNSVQPLSATFDIVQPADLHFEMDLSINAMLTEVKNGNELLRSGEDYAVSGNILTIKRKYLSTLAPGKIKLDLLFDKRNSLAVTIDIIDSTPTVAPGPFLFDKKTSAQADVLVGIVSNGYRIQSISRGKERLNPDQDYVVTNDTIALKKQFLATLDAGRVELTVTFNEVIQLTIQVDVRDTSSTIDPEYVRVFIKDSVEQDVVVTYTPYGDRDTELIDIYLGDRRLTREDDYTQSGTSVTIRSRFISSLEQGITKLHFVMSDGSEPALQIHVIEDTLSAEITSLTATTVEDRVVVKGTIDSGADKQITIMIHNPNGELEYIGQAGSGAQGHFLFSYKKSSHLHGSYSVRVGGEWVDHPQETTFHYTWEPPITVADMVRLLTKYRDEIYSQGAYSSLSAHLATVGRFEKKEEAKKVVEHMESFIQLLNHWRNKGELSKSAYDALLRAGNSLVRQWQ